MNSYIKAALAVVAALLILAVLVWVGAFLYWHFRISNAISVVEKSPSKLVGRGREREVEDALSSLESAGCRSLPYVIDSIDPEKDPDFVMEMIYQLTSQVILAPKHPNDEVDATLTFLHKCVLREQDTSDLRALKCNRLHVWWVDNRASYYQWWRVWSPKCR